MYNYNDNDDSGLVAFCAGLLLVWLSVWMLAGFIKALLLAGVLLIVYGLSVA